MGRTVAVPGNALATVYINVSEHDADTWDDFVEDLRNVIQEKYPSFTAYDKWVGRESRVILERDGAFVILCEYCGLASVSLGSCYGTPLVQHWVRSIAANWRKHLEKRYPSTALRHVATTSNGEGVYERAV